MSFQLFNEKKSPHMYMKTHQIENDQTCSPWGEQIQNYKRQLISKQTNGKRIYSNRYRSELQAYPSKLLSPHNKKNPIIRSTLRNKSVNLEYEPNKDANLDDKTIIIDNVIKLPFLIPQKIFIKQSKFNYSESNDKYNILILNNRKSLKKYNSKNRREQTLTHFEAYKKTLIAARRYVKTIMPEISNSQMTIL